MAIATNEREGGRERERERDYVVHNLKG